MDNTIMSKLLSIEKVLNEQKNLKKNVLTFTEAAEYLGLSKSNLYKMTSAGKIPFYKPNGKNIYFNRTELDNWIFTNRHASDEELEKQADEHIIKKGRATI